jgi:hypothetical protein
VFWTSWAEPSLKLLRDLAGRERRAEYAELTVLAINDGESERIARRTFARLGLSAHLVVDPGRDIAAGYGISCWPTLISVSPDGRVGTIGFGLPSESPPLPKEPPASFRRASAE